MMGVSIKFFLCMNSASDEIKSLILDLQQRKVSPCSAADRETGDVGSKTNSDRCSSVLR